MATTSPQALLLLRDKRTQSSFPVAEVDASPGLGHLEKELPVTQITLRPQPVTGPVNGTRPTKNHSQCLKCQIWQTRGTWQNSIGSQNRGSMGIFLCGPKSWRISVEICFRINPRDSGPIWNAHGAAEWCPIWFTHTLGLYSCTLGSL